MGEVLRFQAVTTVRATAEALWPLVADTGRLNQIVGLPPVRYRAQPRPEGGSTIQAEYVLAGITLVRWDEEPFQWQAPRFYYVLRRYHWGPIRWFKGGLELETVDSSHTRVLSYAEFVPSAAVWRWVVQEVIGPRSAESVIRQCAFFERYLQGQIPDPFPQLQPAAHRRWKFRTPPRSLLAMPVVSHPEPSTPAHAAEGAWQQLERSVGNAALLKRMRQHFADAPDDQVAKMRPYLLADRWGLPRRAVLVAFLHATTAGVVQMSWDVLCPHCRVAKSAYGSLKDVKGEAFCDQCNLRYEALLDRNVEVRFTVSPSVRRVESMEFCIGGPMRTPHLVSRLTLAPGASAELTAQLGSNRYELKSPQSSGVLILDVSADWPPEQVDHTATVDLYADHLRPGALDLAPGAVAVTVANRLSVPATVEVEQPDWPDTAATAALVSTLPEFRDLFASDVLAPGIQVAIQRLTVLFTDLAGSTALYQSVGQAQAFRLVQDHFRRLFALVAEHDGTVVKTIGDSVMAVFPSAVSGLEAALGMQRAMRDSELRTMAQSPLMLRVGLHQGPCLAATANDRIDYFGTTVNVAARVEGQCQPGQVTLTEDVWADPAVAARLGSPADLAVERATMKLRGIRDPLQVYRLVRPTEV